MNLVDMARRSDKNLVLDAGFVSTGGMRWESAKRAISHIAGSFIHASKRTINGVLYRGFDLSADSKTRLSIKSPFKWYPFRQRPDLTGWQIMAVDRKAEGSALRVLLKRRSTDTVLAHYTVTLSSSFEPVRLPCPSNDRGNSTDYDLVLTFESAARGRAFLAVHRVLDRAEIIKLCRGRGVEIGPGPNPQILPSDDCDVTYVEQSSPEKWESLYNDRGALHIERSLWARYTIGEAYPLPAEDHSLDFVFCSHVFEHLANPLGHLEHWYGKLHRGGVVVGVVPDIGGSKDYVFEPCLVDDLLDEYASGLMQPSLDHYRRWAAHRAPGKDPVEFLNAGRSIHVHFYTYENMSSLLNCASKRLGYDWFNIHYTPNHKDFYFVIGK